MSAIEINLEDDDEVEVEPMAHAAGTDPVARLTLGPIGVWVSYALLEVIRDAIDRVLPAGGEGP